MATMNTVQTDIISASSTTHVLIGKWNLYYHLPSDTKWDLSSYTVILGNISSADQIVALNESIPEQVVKFCMLFVMRQGITPMWEDPKNRVGGCFSYKIPNKIVCDVWKTLLYLCCGESLTVKPEHSKYVNGITISPKKNFCIVKIWMNTLELQDPTIIRQISNLPIQGCLFKKHEPEF